MGKALMWGVGYEQGLSVSHSLWRDRRSAATPCRPATNLTIPQWLLSPDAPVNKLKHNPCVC